MIPFWIKGAYGLLLYNYLSISALLSATAFPRTVL